MFFDFAQISKRKRPRRDPDLPRWAPEDLECAFGLLFSDNDTTKTKFYRKTSQPRTDAAKLTSPEVVLKREMGTQMCLQKTSRNVKKKNGNIERHGIHRVPDGGALVLSIKSGLFFRKTSQKRHFCFSRQSHRGANRTKFLYDDPRSKKIFFNNLTKNGVSSTLVEY